MFSSLMADMIGVTAGPEACIDLAAQHGFDGIDLRITRDAEAIRQGGTAALRAQIAARGLRCGYCSLLPGKMSCDDAEWSQGMHDLPELARLAAELGYTRTATVVLPFHDHLPFDDCFALHVRRLAEAMPVLRDHGLSLGLEYVAPISRRRGQKHAFIHNLAGLRRLMDAGGEGVGVMLDSFHWHCAQETADDLRSLSADEVVVVHVNDLPDGRPLDQHVVNDRALPGATGLIDLDTFCGALRGIGYDGPVTCEPTHPRWSTTDPDTALRDTAEAMRRTLGTTTAC